MAKIRLGVNIDHAATLRQVRGGTTAYPDILKVAEEVIRGGADLITIHLREDRRHIQDRDLEILSKNISVPLNLELSTDWKMVRIARKYRPHWVCFVPEKRKELTTEGGLDALSIKKKLKKQIESLHFIGIEISLFIEPSIKQVEAAYEVGADAVEFHTGHWVLLKGVKKKMEWKRLQESAKRAHQLGLSVHAGHGLDYHDAKKIRSLPYLEEVNIGHSMICHALFDGLEKVTRKMKSYLR